MLYLYTTYGNVRNHRPPLKPSASMPTALGRREVRLDADADVALTTFSRLESGALVLRGGGAKATREARGLRCGCWLAVAIWSMRELIS